MSKTVYQITFGHRRGFVESIRTRDAEEAAKYLNALAHLSGFDGILTSAYAIRELKEDESITTPTDDLRFASVTRF